MRRPQPITIGQHFFNNQCPIATMVTLWTITMSCLKLEMPLLYHKFSIRYWKQLVCYKFFKWVRISWSGFKLLKKPNPDSKQQPSYLWYRIQSCCVGGTHSWSWRPQVLNMKINNYTSPSILEVKSLSYLYLNISFQKN